MLCIDVEDHQIHKGIVVCIDPRRSVLDAVQRPFFSIF